MSLSKLAFVEGVTSSLTFFGVENTDAGRIQRDTMRKALIVARTPRELTRDSIARQFLGMK